MGVLFYWSHQPELPIDALPEPGLLHLVSHIAAYFILGGLLALGSGTSRRGLWTAFALAALYGVSDEIHQSFVPGRDANAWQVLLDSAAAGGAILISAQLRSLRGKPMESGSIGEW